MAKEKEQKIPIYTSSGTPSLASAERIVNSTDNKLSSFNDKTVDVFSNFFIIRPIFEKLKDKSKG